MDHLQAKNDSLKNGGKSHKARKRHADQTWAAQTYEELQEELNRERHKVRTLTEELRQITNRTMSPRK